MYKKEGERGVERETETQKGEGDACQLNGVSLLLSLCLPINTLSLKTHTFYTAQSTGAGTVWQKCLKIGLVRLPHVA